MAKREIFSFDMTGFDVMIAELDRIDNEMEKRLDEVLTRIALKVIADARKLAPIDEGDLEAALNIGQVKKKLVSMYIDLGTSPEVDHYAIVQHEGFRKTKDGKIIQMSPGEKTRSKGAHGGYMPGKKFLENAIKMNEEWAIKELAAALHLG